MRRTTQHSSDIYLNFIANFLKHEYKADFEARCGHWVVAAVNGEGGGGYASFLMLFITTARLEAISINHKS